MSMTDYRPRRSWVSIPTPQLRACRDWWADRLANGPFDENFTAERCEDEIAEAAAELALRAAAVARGKAQ